MKKLTYYSIILLVLIPLTNIQAQTEPWFDGKYCKSYKLLWQDAITETHLSKPFTMETFNEFGWCLKTNGFRTEKPDNNKFGGFSRAPDGKPAVQVLYPAMSFWENGGISIETKHFPSKEQSIDTILYAYDVMLEVDPTQYPFLSAPEVTENTSISGKLFGLTSNNFSSGNFTPSQQTGFVIREVWRGNKSTGVNIGSYDYHLNRAEGNGPNYGKSIGESIPVQPLTWIKVVREVILNEHGKENGKSRLWINGIEAAYKDDILYRMHDKYYIEGIRFVTFNGSAHPYLVDTSYHKWFRNFQLWVPDNEHKTIMVSNSVELEKAVSKADAGTHIILHDGIYNSPINISSSGTNEAPIVIRAKNLHKAVFTAPITLNGSYTTVSGIQVDGPGMVLGGNFNRISRCKIYFSGKNGACVTVIAGKGGRVDRCDMSVSAEGLSHLTSRYEYGRSGINMNHPNHFNLRADRNYFHDWPSRGANQPFSAFINSIIRISWGGEAAFEKTNAVIEYNLFENCHLTDHYAGNSIHFKCSGNTARFNTIINSPCSRIDSRCGEENSFYGNYMENAVGVLIFGPNHKLIGNEFINCREGISLYAGNVLERDSIVDGYPRSYNVTVAGNTSNLLTIGKSWNTAWKYPASHNLIEAHEGPIVKEFEEETTIVPATNYQIPKAFKLEKHMVGPNSASDSEWNYHKQISWSPLPLPTLPDYTKEPVLFDRHKTLFITQEFIEKHRNFMRTDRGSGVGYYPLQYMDIVSLDNAPALEHRITKGTGVIGPQHFKEWPRVNDFRGVVVRYQVYYTGYREFGGKQITLEGGRGYIGKGYRTGWSFYTPAGDTSKYGTEGWSVYSMIARENYFFLMAIDKTITAELIGTNKGYGYYPKQIQDKHPLNQWITIDIVADMKHGYTLYQDGKKTAWGNDVTPFLENPLNCKYIAVGVRLMYGGNPEELIPTKDHKEYYRNCEVFIYE